MAISKSNLKRAIAKEILYLFSALVLVALVWVFLLLRNSYYNNKARSYSQKSNSLKIQLDTLPKDYVKEYYDLMSKYFVVYYKKENDTFTITKQQEEELYFKLGLPQKVTRVPISPRPYSYLKINCVIVKQGTTIYFSDKKDLGKQVKEIFSAYTDMADTELGNKVLKEFHQQTDSAIGFDFVSIDKFREFLNSKDYVVKLHTIFSNSPAPSERVNNSQKKWKPKFDPMQPYYAVFDLGTLSEFKANVNEGLRYNSTVIKVKKRIETDIQRQLELASSSKENLLTSEGINRFLFYALLIIVLLLYPIRLSTLSILWAFKTLKQEK